MDFFSYGVPLGRYFGIQVRLHFTFLIYAFYRLQESHNMLLGLLLVTAIYFCILLHEFGHALAARWCDGEANDILLWPLGGLAFVRPAFHPTAHLITTVAGPFVTLLLWIGLRGLAHGLVYVSGVPFALVIFLHGLSVFNLYILLFNLIPAFPMDGGRILRDTLWHWMSAEKATVIAVNVSRVVAVAGIGYAILQQQYWLIILAAFILLQSMQERAVVAFEAGGQYDFSIRERLRRGRRQREFRRAVTTQAKVEATTAFHRCATCGLTEVEDPTMDFRVCPDCSGGQEYCRKHLDAHSHA